MAIPKAENPAVIVAGFAALDDFHDAEIPAAVMGQRMSLAADLEAGGGQRALNRLDELMVRNWHPGTSGCGCGDLLDLIECNSRCAAVEDEVWVSAFRGGRGLFEEMDHEGLPFYFGCASVE